MAFIGREELEALRARAAEADRLEHDLAFERDVSAIADDVRSQLRDLESSPLISDQAREAARGLVFMEHEGDLRGRIAQGLKEAEGDRFRAELETKQGPTIRNELDVFFQTDGTYEGVRAQTEADFRAELHQKVIDEYRLRTRTEIENDPEARVDIINQMIEQMKIDGTYDAIRQEVITELEHLWNEQARTQARAQINEEELMREDEYVAARTANVLNGSDSQIFRRELRVRLESEWNNLSLQDARARINDEELQRIIDIRLEQIAKEIDEHNKRITAEQLLDAFLGKGIDTLQIPEGSSLTLTLGETGVFRRTRKVRNSYGGVDNQEYDAKGVFCDRSLRLTSLGEGRFVVLDDSLDGSSSPYEREHALPRDTVIVLGRILHENGDRKFVRTIVADTTLYYDDNTTNDDVIDSKLTVANVEIDGVVARPVEVVEHRHNSSSK